MNASERHLLAELRRALLHLHKTLLEWERAGYERLHGRVTGHELLHATLNDPQFAWLRPLSEFIVRIDEALDQTEPAETSASEAGALARAAAASAILDQARELVLPDEAGSAFAQRYYTALQEHPDAVFAHRAVTDVLKQVPTH